MEFSEDDGDPTTKDPVRHGVEARIDLVAANRRVMELAAAQSSDIASSLTEAGVTVIEGRGRLLGRDYVEVERADGSREPLRADTVLLATGGDMVTVLLGDAGDGDTDHQIGPIAAQPPDETACDENSAV